MKKNLIIISLILILPILAYAILSNNNVASAQKLNKGKPQIVKFSSKLCSDCKKIKQGFEELRPTYEKQIDIVEYDVEKTDTNTQNAIKKYNINLVPTIIFINSNGREIRRTEGFVKTEELKTYFDELVK